MDDSVIATSNFSSRLESRESTRITWTIEGLYRFLELHPEINQYMDQISCRFQGSLDSNQIPVAWRLHFLHSSLVLKRESGSGSDKVFVYVNIEVLNSENVKIYSKNSELLTMSLNTAREFSLEDWDLHAITHGPVKIHCKIDQLTWNNVETTKRISLAAIENRKQFLGTDLKSLLESGEHADVSLKLYDGNVASAHKAILSARSPVFNRMFSTQMKESEENAVEMDYMGQEALTELLSYIYTGELNLKGKSLQSLRELVNAADKYQLADMKQLCNENLPECCDTQNAFELLKLAKLHGLEDSEGLISSFIELNISNILQSVLIVE